ncbi:MAG: cytochrome c oxidase subunit II transmembrane domain-containing protein, partial [Acidobacteriota bacterium]
MNTWLRDLFLPSAASIKAQSVDDLFMFILWLNIIFFILIAGLTILFCIQYKRRSANQKTAHIEHHTVLELTWTVLPLILCLIVFFWGFNTYMQAGVA